MELDEFVCEHNLERFRRLANLSTSAAERQAILELLAEEVAKLKSVHKGPAGKARKVTHQPTESGPPVVPEHGATLAQIGTPSHLSSHIRICTPR